ncbi:MAG: Nif3-like dinuclear metal center hexameric protein [Clostridia bacterium]|nr:Nif3-like dinuclear metal center hexameric protein [Clostridia bacterium]
MTTSDLYRALREKIPAAMAYEWDNDGVMCLPEPSRPARRVLLVLDITDEAVDHAIRNNYDLIVSHHPLIFKGIKHLTTEDIIARRCIKLCRYGITALSFHTALDAMDGVNDRLAAALGLTDITPFGDRAYPVGRLGSLPAPMPAETFAAHVAQTLNCTAVTVGNPEIPAYRIAVIGGSGEDDIPAAIAAGADTMVTGEAGYHEMLDAAAMGFDVITAGHFFTEQSTLVMLKELLASIDPSIQSDVYNTNRMLTVVSARGVAL